MVKLELVVVEVLQILVMSIMFQDMVAVLKTD